MRPTGWSGALTTPGVDHDVKEYPDAGHGFLNDHDGAGDSAPILFAVLGKLMLGAGYHDHLRGMRADASSPFSTHT